MSGECSIYIHLPFCDKKCPYCDFFVMTSCHHMIPEFIHTLTLEWEQRKQSCEEYKIVSLYFGGGTPSLLDPIHIQTLVSLFPKDIEITLEANPDSLTTAKLQAYQDIGIQRLSLGVQSFQPQELKTLGRTHTVEDTIAIIHQAHRIGFNNISIDLMYDLPHQTIASWQQSLQIAVELPITHLSLYNLTFEPRTLFTRQQHVLKPLLPQEQESTAMIPIAQQLLAPRFKRYEISAFAYEHYTSLHNIGYWTNRAFIGLGPSAFSYINHKRFQNKPHLSHYMQAIQQHTSAIGFSESLSPLAQHKEYLALRLRLLTPFSIKPWSYDEELLRTLQKLQSQGLIQQEHDTISLTELGTNFYDTVAAEIIEA